MVAIKLAGAIMAPLLSNAFISPSALPRSTTSVRSLLLSASSSVSEVHQPKIQHECSPSDYCAASMQRIICDIDGRPLTPEYLAEAMGIKTVESYSCPEEDAFRGLMSNGGRLRLHPGGETAFYKRIEFEHLEHAQEKLKKSPHKLLRDTKSYLVVANFLSSVGCKQMVEKTGVCIPKCYDAQLKPDFDDPMKSKFTFLLEDFSPENGWYQRWLIDDEAECKEALSSLAKIHAFFWEGSDFWKDKDAADEFEAAVWKSGSYIQPKAQNANQCEKVAGKWEKERWKIEKEISSLDFWDNLGQRLQSVSELCGRLAHPFAHEDLRGAYRKYRTFTHGDPKSANLFFRKGETGNLQVGLIDFQWSGFGLAATDIAHFISAGVDADLLVDGGEKRLLRYYYDKLQSYLVNYGVFDSSEKARKGFEYNVFQEQYDIAVLDICRLVIAYTWSRFTESVDKRDVMGCARTFNKTSYNKSISASVWLMSRCDETLKCRQLDTNRLRP